MLFNFGFHRQTRWRVVLLQLATSCRADKCIWVCTCWFWHCVLSSSCDGRNGYFLAATSHHRMLARQPNFSSASQSNLIGQCFLVHRHYHCHQQQSHPLLELDAYVKSALWRAICPFLRLTVCIATVNGLSTWRWKYFRFRQILGPKLKRVLEL